MAVNAGVETDQTEAGSAFAMEVHSLATTSGADSVVQVVGESDQPESPVSPALAPAVVHLPCAVARAAALF